MMAENQKHVKQKYNDEIADLDNRVSKLKEENAKLGEKIIGKFN
jgi:hypothetical protein